MDSYKVILSRKTESKALSYLEKLRLGNRGGTYLHRKIIGVNLKQIELPKFLEILVRTKKPQRFAESQVYGDGSDWTQDELSILGDITFALPVTIFDNGLWSNPKIHTPPFGGTLLFTSGALLRNEKGVEPSDWAEVVKDKEVELSGLYHLYERRLLPPLTYANKLCQDKGVKAFIPVPGLGCGLFAGDFHGTMGIYLKDVLRQILENHGKMLANIKAVYFDPYSECTNERCCIHGIHYMVRPFNQGNQEKPQLCLPTRYQEQPEDDFSDCEFFSFVAWDHVAWPGNDFLRGTRNTDDGVKAAATDTMRVMTGYEGDYDPSSNKYCPPLGYQNWEEVIVKNRIQLKVVENLLVIP